MNSRSLIILIVAVVLVGTGLTFTLLTPEQTSTEVVSSTNTQIRVVDIDDAVNDPDRYTGIIGVRGLVSGVGASGGSFALGCKDACALMPVQYAGQVPEEGTDIIAYGEIKKNEQARYFFVAERLAIQ